MRIEQLCAVIVAGLVLTACGGPDDEGLSPVETSLAVTGENDYHLELTGAVDDEIEGRGANRTPAQDQSGEAVGSSLQVTGPNFSLMMTVPAEEGETGTFETIRTVQGTYESQKFYDSEPLKVTLETHSGGNVVGAVAGELDKKSKEEGSEKWDPPLRIEGAFDFEY